MKVTYFFLFLKNYFFIVDAIFALELSKDNRYLVTGSADQSVKIIDFDARLELHHFKNIHASIHNIFFYFIIFVDSVSHIAISSDNKYIITGSGDKSVKVLSVEAKIEIYCFENMHKGNTDRALFLIELRCNTGFKTIS